MVCREIFGDCRCYAYKGENEQFCAKRWGVNILPCSSDCCVGGCPDDGSRQPYRFIDRPGTCTLFYMVAYYISNYILLH